MRTSPIIRVLFCLLSVMVGHMSVASAQEKERPAVHVEVVLDSSGSMKTSDPTRLSVLGAMIFTDLGHDEDLLGLRSMKKPGFTIEPLQPVGSNRDKLRKSAKKLAFKGGTDCAGPLGKAAEALREKRAEDATAAQFVIFLSDGACPEKHAGALKAAALKLGKDGVRVFTIGLIDPTAPDPEMDLKQLARDTDGEYFRADKASDLPQMFAGILGRIVGSEAVDLAFTPGKASQVGLDGYVRDASLIVTGPRAVRVTRANGPDGKSIGIRVSKAPYSNQGKGYLSTADTSKAGQHYTVVRLDEPAFGDWSFVIDAPAGASALLIQNYALEPHLDELPDVVTLGDKTKVTCFLKSTDGKKLVDPEFLEKVGVELEIVSPDGKTSKVLMTRANHNFTHELEWAASGRNRVRARAFMKAGGLNKRTPFQDVVAIDQDLAFTTEGPIDLGDVKAGAETDPHELSMGHSRLGKELQLTLKTQGVPGVTASPSTSKITPENQDISVAFVIDPDHAGGPVEGELIVSADNDSTSIKLRANVLPITFWERWGELIILVSSGLALLLLLIFLVYGFTSPYTFSGEAIIRWGNSMDRLKKNDSIIVDMEGTGRGFYKNAKLTIGGSTSSLPVGGTAVAELEATGVNRVTIRALGGAELVRVNKFDESKKTPIDGGETGMSSGDTYQVGELFLRLE